MGLRKRSDRAPIVSDLKPSVQLWLPTSRASQEDLAGKLQIVARSQSEKRTDESETNGKQPMQRELDGPASTIPHLERPPSHVSPPPCSELNQMNVNALSPTRKITNAFSRQPDHLESAQHANSKIEAPWQRRPLPKIVPPWKATDDVPGSMDSVCALFYLFYWVFPRAKTKLTSPRGFIKFEIAATRALTLEC